MTAKLLQFPQERTNIVTLARAYLDIYEEKGWLGAGQYWTQNVPPQLSAQVKNEFKILAQQRGFNVTL